MENKARSNISRPAARRSTLGRARNGLFVIVAALAAYAAVAQPPAHSPKLLNSERIQQRFGSYGIEVLSSDASVRVSDLYSLQNGRKVCRTFAVTLYPSKVDPSFAAEHAAILEGGSIGAVFKQHGWTVTKKNLYFGTLASTPKVAKLMHDRSGKPLAVHIYGLYISKADASFQYATIAEVHHPDYLSLQQLEEIYGAIDSAPAGRDELVQHMLAVVADKMR